MTDKSWLPKIVQGVEGRLNEKIIRIHCIGEPKPAVLVEDYPEWYAENRVWEMKERNITVRKGVREVYIQEAKDFLAERGVVRKE